MLTRPPATADVDAFAVAFEVAVNDAAPVIVTTEFEPMKAWVSWPICEVSVTPTPEPNRPMFTIVAVAVVSDVPFATAVNDVPVSCVSGPMYTRVFPFAVALGSRSDTAATPNAAPVVRPFAVLLEVACSVTGPLRVITRSGPVGASARLPTNASTLLWIDAVAWVMPNVIAVIAIPRAVAAAFVTAFASTSSESAVTFAPPPTNARVVFPTVAPGRRTFTATALTAVPRASDVAWSVEYASTSIGPVTTIVGVPLTPFRSVGAPRNASTVPFAFACGVTPAPPPSEIAKTNDVARAPYSTRLPESPALTVSDPDRTSTLSRTYARVMPVVLAFGCMMVTDSAPPPPPCASATEWIDESALTTIAPVLTWTEDASFELDPACWPMNASTTPPAVAVGVS